MQGFQSIIVPYQPAAGRSGQARPAPAHGAVGRDERVIWLGTGRGHGDQDQVDPGIARRDAGLRTEVRK
jgi:hypothetical protein